MSWTPETLKELFEAQHRAVAVQVAAVEEQQRTMQSNWNRRFGQLDERIEKELSATRAELGELRKAIDAITKRAYIGVGIVMTVGLAAEVLIQVLHH